MGYVCVDRGTRRCPCILMAAGQCYTCTMSRTGRCSCEEGAGWQGLCPYTEYVLRGKEPVSAEPEPLERAAIIERTDYEQEMTVIAVEVSAGFAQACMEPGAYFMAEALGCRMPLSVLRARRRGRRGRVEAVVKAAGPKSMALLKKDEWKLAGPYYAGLLHGERLKNPEKKRIVIGRGLAAVPYFALRQLPRFRGEAAGCNGEAAGYDAEDQVYLDTSTLPEAFLGEYFCGQPYEKILLSQAETVSTMIQVLKQAIHQGAEALLLVSPYYEKQFTDRLTDMEKKQLIVPNQHNLCCGTGLCGACSHTDENGITVRLCKCSPAVIE